ncbi:cysteine-rich repeat secretory protein 55-like [Andrographis paniculata]|uniref:cysteine-rich repeat secretory protein 55-like n=1 Tax=Andrographis paniculata TaxID=175694 RepID=UPI0021E70086|nr:cysteine-rich repeat secretory protein 55-like [Andrographis paniculata]
MKMNLIIILYSSFSLLFLYSSCSADPIHHLCGDDTKVKDYPEVSRNIAILVDKVGAGATNNGGGFSATSYGAGLAEAFGLAQCRQDVPKADCAACIRDATVNIRKLCPVQADAKIWYDYCFLRYKLENFFGQVDTSGIYYYNVANADDPNTFNKKLGALMQVVRSDATKAGNKGLGKGQTKISTFLTLYGLAQCTRDLSDINCAQCLAIGIGNFERFCKDKIGCRVVYSTCYIRYELYPFYFPLDATAMANLSERSAGKNYKTFIPRTL